MPTQIKQSMVQGLVTALATLTSSVDAKAATTSIEQKRTTAVDRTANRVANTPYQNTGSSARDVYISLTPAASSNIYLQISVNGTDWVALTRQSDTVRRSHYASVPPGFYYRLNYSTGSATIDFWSEVA